MLESAGMNLFHRHALNPSFAAFLFPLPGIPDHSLSSGFPDSFHGARARRTLRFSRIQKKPGHTATPAFMNDEESATESSSPSTAQVLRAHFRQAGLHRLVTTARTFP